MLPGLRSLWITPLAWAAATALAGQVLAVDREPDPEGPGEPLADDPSPTADTERTGLAELRLQVQRDLADAEVRAGCAAEVLPQLEALVADHPLREDLVLVQMEALAADGRPAEALAAYERLRRDLAERLGADPSPALRARHLELLRLPDGGLVPPTNLRAAVTSFVGRDQDAARRDTGLADEQRRGALAHEGRVIAPMRLRAHAERRQAFSFTGLGVSNQFPSSRPERSGAEGPRLVH